MTYQPSDIAARLKRLLPKGWFGDITPILDSILVCLGSGWTSFFTLRDFILAQSRISKSGEIWLDIAAQDFFAGKVTRKPGETDGIFRNRLIWYLQQDRCTRSAVAAALANLTGSNPSIFEPGQPRDTGCYGGNGSESLAVAGYGVNGGWGSNSMPFQALILVTRPPAPNTAFAGGWQDPSSAYGGGVAEYLNGSTHSNGISDQDVIDQILYSAPAASCLWLSII
jgi:hypothetical protein